VYIIAIGLISAILSSCGGETLFPKEPEAHKLFDEVQEWPDEYYYLVASGVSSRVMGLRSAEALLDVVKEQWADIETLETADELITYFRAQYLVHIAEAIESTLSQNRPAEPSGDSHLQLQADAIKRGLLYAFWEVKGQPSS
jgi:hypothetical protein